MKKKNKTAPSLISKLFSKLLVLTVIILICLITLKGNADLRESVYKKVFETNFSFTKINSLYNKYFGNALPLKSEKEKTETVSNIALDYTNAESYKDGVKFTVKENYLVSNQNSGLVLYVGEKEGYGNTIIIQRPDNVEVWYSNLKNINVSLYDYIKKGDTLGEVDGTNLYMVFTKEGKNLNYKDYI